jgi:hypothetical protein
MMQWSAKETTMSQSAATFPTDEAPTKPILCSATLVVASKIERLCELALEKLLVDPDPHTIVSACEDLAQIRQLAGQVMR